MKVAHITPSFYPALVYGGPTESVYQLCRAVAKAGDEVRVLTTNANGKDQILDVPPDVETALEPRLTVRYCSRLFWDSVSLSLVKQLYRYIAWADVVHLEAAYSFPTLPTLWVARRLRKPVVWTPRGALARWGGARHRLMKRMIDRACQCLLPRGSLFHFTSEPEKKGSLKRFPGREGVIIANGVHVPESIGTPKDSDTLRVLCLGRLDPIKGIENLIEACARLRTPVKDRWVLTIAGAGTASYTARLERKIRSLDLQGRIDLIGYVKGQEKEMLLSNVDVVIVPSHLENFCLVVAEALAHGVPVIASRGTPWPQLETQGAGLWVENDPDVLARSIERMATMPRREMGNKGRAWMKAEFEWSRIGVEMIALYEKAAEGIYGKR